MMYVKDDEKKNVYISPVCRIQNQPFLKFQCRHVRDQVVSFPGSLFHEQDVEEG